MKALLYSDLLELSSSYMLEPLSLSKIEPIITTQQDVFGCEILLGDRVILGNKNEAFRSASVVFDLVILEIHLEKARSLRYKRKFINVKPETLVQFGDRIAELYCQDIVFEIVESRVDLEILGKISHLKHKYGFRIAIDDFGTEGSNIDRIVSIRPDFVKIDMGVFKHIPYKCKQSALINISRLIKSLSDAEIIAEKVEMEEDLEVIHYAGINLWQGYLSVNYR